MVRSEDFPDRDAASEAVTDILFLIITVSSRVRAQQDGNVTTLLCPHSTTVTLRLVERGYFIVSSLIDCGDDRLGRDLIAMCDCHQLLGQIHLHLLNTTQRRHLFGNCIDAMLT